VQGLGTVVTTRCGVRCGEVGTGVADWRLGEVLRGRLTEAHGLAVGLLGTRRPGRWCSAAAPEFGPAAMAAAGS
jgi:hypothetical protein